MRYTLTPLERVQIAQLEFARPICCRNSKLRRFAPVNLVFVAITAVSAAFAAGAAVGGFVIAALLRH